MARRIYGYAPRAPRRGRCPRTRNASSITLEEASSDATIAAVCRLRRCRCRAAEPSRGRTSTITPKWRGEVITAERAEEASNNVDVDDPLLTRTDDPGRPRRRWSRGVGAVARLDPWSRPGAPPPRRSAQDVSASAECREGGVLSLVARRGREWRMRTDHEGDLSSWIVSGSFCGTDAAHAYEAGGVDAALSAAMPMRCGFAQPHVGNADVTTGGVAVCKAVLRRALCSTRRPGRRAPVQPAASSCSRMPSSTTFRVRATSSDSESGTGRGGVRLGAVSRAAERRSWTRRRRFRAAAGRSCRGRHGAGRRPVSFGVHGAAAGHARRGGFARRTGARTPRRPGPTTCSRRWPCSRCSSAAPMPATAAGPRDPALPVAVRGVLRAPTFSFSGRLDRLDWVFYWADVVAILSLPPLFLDFTRVFPERRRARSRFDRAVSIVTYAPAVVLGCGGVVAVARSSADAALFVRVSEALDRLELLDPGHLLHRRPAGAHPRAGARPFLHRPSAVEVDRVGHRARRHSLCVRMTHSPWHAVWR